jgi:hypothetical protein
VIFSEQVDLAGENIRIDGRDEEGGGLSELPPETCTGLKAREKVFQ